MTAAVCSFDLLEDDDVRVLPLQPVGEVVETVVADIEIVRDQAEADRIGPQPSRLPARAQSAAATSPARAATPGTLAAAKPK